MVSPRAAPQTGVCASGWGARAGHHPTKRRIRIRFLVRAQACIVGAVPDWGNQPSVLASHITVSLSLLLLLLPPLSVKSVSVSLGEGSTVHMSIYMGAR